MCIFHTAFLGEEGSCGTAGCGCHGNAVGLDVSHCITWFQIQLILTTCQIRYHTRCGIIVALDSSEP